MKADTIFDKQSQLNRSTSGQWILYSSHRQELERLIVPPRRGGTLCVLGAGNCNDLDLNWLVQVYRQVTLVDIDGHALERGATFQRVHDLSAIRRLGSIDLTGLAGRLGPWAEKRPTADEVRACTKLAATPADATAAELGGPFDAVVSPCVLSQLLTPLRDFLGQADPGFEPLLSAMRARHFALMAALLRPGGRGIFACDLFSSAVQPNLSRIPKVDLPDLMRQMVRDEKYFSHLDPASIARALKTSRPASGQFANVQCVAPWLWHLGIAKTYLVYGMTFDRTGMGQGSTPAAPRTVIERPELP